MTKGAISRLNIPQLIKLAIINLEKLLEIEDLRVGKDILIKLLKRLGKGSNRILGYLRSNLNPMPLEVVTMHLCQTWPEIMKI